MNLLSNEALVEAYLKAVRLHLEEEFISLLVEEIRRRNLELPLEPTQQ